MIKIVTGGRLRTAFRITSALVLASLQVRAQETKLYPAPSQTGWGYINSVGVFVIPPTFQKAGSFSEGLASVSIGHRFGYINANGVFLIEAKYDDAQPFSSGVAFIKLGNAWGAINKSGSMIIEPGFEEPLLFRDGFADYSPSSASLVKANFFDTAGKRVWSSSQADMVVEYGDGLAWKEEFRVDPVKRLPIGMWTVIDTKQRSVSQPMTACLVPKVFSDGLAGLQRNCKEKFGYVDETGKQLIPANFDFMRPFSEGLGAVAVGKKWGFVKKDGTFQIPPKFDYLLEFSSGLAAAVEGTHFGYIDHAGNWAIPPKFDIFPNSNLRKMLRSFDGDLALIVLVKSTPKPDVLFEYINKKGSIVYGPISIAPPQ